MYRDKFKPETQNKNKWRKLCNLTAKGFLESLEATLMVAVKYTVLRDLMLYGLK
jgi:hypothetical protein